MTTKHTHWSLLVNGLDHELLVIEGDVSDLTPRKPNLGCELVVLLVDIQPESIYSQPKLCSLLVLDGEVVDTVHLQVLRYLEVLKHGVFPKETQQEPECSPQKIMCQITEAMLKWFYYRHSIYLYCVTRVMHSVHKFNSVIKRKTIHLKGVFRHQWNSALDIRAPMYIPQYGFVFNPPVQDSLFPLLRSQLVLVQHSRYDHRGEGCV